MPAARGGSRPQQGAPPWPDAPGAAGQGHGQGQGQGQAPAAGGGGGSASSGGGLMSQLRSSFVSRRIEDVCVFEPNMKSLGKGSFATVYKARMKGTNRACAVKVMDKAALQRMNVTAAVVKSEVDFMRACVGQDLFVQLHDFVEGTTRYYIVLEFCSGGNLQEAAETGDGDLRENEVRPLMVQMLQAIAYLHSVRICHRDVKPHNFLAVGRLKSDSVKVKLADFGIAVNFTPGKLIKEQVGTPAFMAPEIHLLPNKSPGYDEKVDIWAVGVVMVFLLAAEYPFVDGAGRLLRDQLVRGDLPLWGGDNAFAGMFQAAQEAVGMKRKRPSRGAQNFIRQLVMPRRERRLSATAALRHEWFTARLPEPGDPVSRIESGFGGALDEPLFDWQDFEESLSFLEKSAVWVADSVADIRMGGFEGPLSNIDTSDERVQSCVVCYGTSGSLGYLCPQCHYAVCLPCLQRLPKPMCPHCRYEPSDMAFAQAAMQYGDRFYKEAQQRFQDGVQLNHLEGLSVSLNHLEGMANFSVDAVSHHGGAVSLKCHCCSKPSAATNYCCLVCPASFCYECARRTLSNTLRCSACGDCARNQEALEQYLYAGEALSRARDLLGGAPAKMGSALGDAVSNSAAALSRQADGVASGVSRHMEAGLRRMSTLGDAADIIEKTVSRGHGLVSIDASVVPTSALNHECVMCSQESAWNDHVCPKCNSTICSTCICSRLAEDPRCPRCGDRDSNAKAMRFVLHTAQAGQMIGDLWRIGSSLLSGDETPAPAPRPAYAPRGEGPSVALRRAAAPAPVGVTAAGRPYASRPPPVRPDNRPARDHTEVTL